MLKRIAVGATIAGACWAAYYWARRQYETWGIDPTDAERSLPGDEVVSEPTMTDTRGITIDAPPSAVWPWLLQMGYGRAGWYSYDRMNTRGRSADEILPEFQSLSVGDTVPTDPRGGFEVKAVEPEQALVLMIDQEIAARRMANAAVSTPAGVEASGRFMQAGMPPEFAVSWAIVLEPREGGRTRLIERVRARLGPGTRGTRMLGPMMGFGIFTMTRRQMLGIAERAERLARSGAPAAPADASQPAEAGGSGNGHAPELAGAVEAGS